VSTDRKLTVQTVNVIQRCYGSTGNALHRSTSYTIVYALLPFYRVFFGIIKTVHKTRSSFDSLAVL